MNYTNTLKIILAKFGVMSIFGNHDYGDYYKWDNLEAKENDIQELKNHGLLGWKLLWDEHHHIEQNGEKLLLSGFRISAAIVLPVMAVWKEPQKISTTTLLTLYFPMETHLHNVEFCFYWL